MQTNNIYTYLIAVKPLSPYFFGGENTFNPSNGEANYFAKGNAWPQQTTLLGMLRYLIGRSHSNINTEDGFIEKWIGETGFRTENQKGYGIINNISPVFLIQEVNEKVNSYWLEAGLDYQPQNNKEILNFRFSDQTTGNSELNGNKKKNFIPLLQRPFEYKLPLKNCMENFYSKEITEPYKAEIFSTFNQIGNKKNYKGQADDSAFFKQEFYILKKGFSFGIIVQTSQVIGFTNELTFMGADQSQFSVTASKIDNNENFFNTIQEHNKRLCSLAKRMVLLSDAYVDNTVLELCDFAICDTVNFRHIETSIHVQNHGSLGNKSGDSDKMNIPKKTTAKYNLLKRGSVLYANDFTHIVKEFDNKAFLNIGYNHFKITE